MQHSSFARALGRSLVLALVCIALGTAVAAALATDAHTESVATLKWRHDNHRNLVKFRLFSSLNVEDPGAESWVDVGLPGAAGIYQWTIAVPHQGEIWVAVSAIDIHGLESARTPWRRFAWDPGLTRLDVPGRAQLVE